MTDQTSQAGEPDPKVAELAVLKASLAELAGEDIHLVLAFQRPARRSVTEAVLSHRQQTAQYKKGQLVAMAPDAAVSQACAYVVLSIIGKNTVASRDLKSTRPPPRSSASAQFFR